MNKILVTIIFVLASAGNTYAFYSPEGGYEFPRDSSLFLLLAADRNMSDDLKSRCENSYQKISDIVLNAEKELLGTESVALKTRLAYAANNAPACRAEIYSFDRSVTLVEKNSEIKKHLSNEESKTACLVDLEKIKSNPMVLFTEYRSGLYSLISGHFCKINYVVVEKK